jgi:Family of unknown function (DUF6338)
VVPATSAAVVTFLLLVTPGTAFELLWQRTRPRRDESTFLEINRVLLTGVLFSGAAAATLVLAESVAPGTIVDIGRLVAQGGGYVAEHPVLCVRTLALALVIALLYAAAAHDVLTAPGSRRIGQESGWHTAFGRLAAPGVRVFLSVQLKDGSTVTGYSAAYSTDPDPGKRDLVLRAPLHIRPPGAAPPHELDQSWQVMLLSGAEISTIAAAYVGSARTTRPGRGRQLVRWAGQHVWQLCLGGVAAVVALLVASALVGY